MAKNYLVYEPYPIFVTHLHIYSQEIVSQEKLFPIEVDFSPALEEAVEGAGETGFDWFIIQDLKLAKSQNQYAIQFQFSSYFKGSFL